MFPKSSNKAASRQCSCSCPPPDLYPETKAWENLHNEFDVNGNGNRFHDETVSLQKRGETPKDVILMPHTEYPEIAAAVAYQYNPEKNVGRRLWIATVVIPRLNALDRMVEGGLNGVGSRSLIINQNGKDILSVDSLKWGLEVEVPFFVPKEQIVGFEPYEGTPPEFRWAQ